MTIVARREGPAFDADLAVRGFFKDPEWMFKVGIGGVINAAALVLALANPLLFPVLIALSAITCGYSQRAVRFRALGVEEKLPEWNEFLELTVSGLTWIALQFGFWTIVVGFATTLFMLGSNLSNPATENAWIVGGILLIAMAIIKMSFVTSYLMVNFAIEENLKGGFAFLEVGKRVWRDPLGLWSAWLLALGLQIASVVAPAITLIGIFFVPSTFFAANVMAADILTQAWIKIDPPKLKPPVKKPGKSGDGPGGGSLPKPSGTKRNL